MKTISIIIPVWNEEETLEKTLTAFGNLSFPNLNKEIICIEDGSTDRTPQILKKFRNKKMFKIFTNKKNLGKSQSVRKGILQSTGDLVVVQDADLEYDPKDLIPMAKMILEGEADVVYGDRYDRSMLNKAQFTNYLGNKFLTTFSNLFTSFRGLRVPDMEVCAKMMKGKIARDIAQALKSKSKFGLEPEITARLARYKLDGRKLRVKVRPVKYFPRTLKQGKKMRYVRDGIKAIWEIIRFNIF